MSSYEVDYSEVIGKKINCLDKCGMCCLCQPEVLPEECIFFKNNYQRSLKKTIGYDSHLAIALKNGYGPCVFLNNRKCTIYENRVTYCRQFPYHLYASDRVKVELDLSCRGAWTGSGNDALTESKKIVANADKRILYALNESKIVYNDFYNNCIQQGVISNPYMLRRSVSNNIRMFTDMSCLSHIINASQTEHTVNLLNIQPNSHPDMDLLQNIGCELAIESMSSNNPLNVPIYCDNDLNWNMFMVVNNKIKWIIMDNDGNIHYKESVDTDDIKLTIPSKSGLEVLSKYISTLNNRDSFMGNVFFIMDENEYEDDMTNAYYGCLSFSIMDLIWRMSMLDYFLGIGSDANGMREAIIFYDMDRLDAPTIGAFI